MGVPVLAQQKRIQLGIIRLWVRSLAPLSGATLEAYGGTWARGRIRAVAASLHHSHSNTGSNHIYDLHHSSRQCWILNQLSEARDQAYSLMVSSQIHFHCATMGTPAMDLIFKTCNSVNAFSHPDTYLHVSLNWAICGSG